MAARRKSPGAPTWALSTEMTMLPKPQAIDSKVTKLGKANLARARRAGRDGFNSGPGKRMMTLFYSALPPGRARSLPSCIFDLA